MPVSNRQTVVNTAKYQTAEAANFISNATLRQTPDSSVTPALHSAKLNSRRPYSGVNQSEANGRLIETEKTVR